MRRGGLFGRRALDSERRGRRDAAIDKIQTTNKSAVGWWNKKLEDWERGRPEGDKAGFWGRLQPCAG